MSETMYLHGSEDVRAGGNAVRQGAEELSRVVSNFEGHVWTLQRALEAHAQTMIDCVERLEAIRRSQP